MNGNEKDLKEKDEDLLAFLDFMEEMLNNVSVDQLKGLQKLIKEELKRR